MFEVLVKRFWYDGYFGRLFSVVRGAAQLIINITDVKALKAPVPTIATQAAIVTTLSAYDNLIENN